MKLDKWLDLSYSFLPIDCCVRINGEPDHLFSDKYLDSDRINFKTFVFLAVYWSIWTSQGRGCLKKGKCVLVHIAIWEYQLILTS